jgi:hypothetical protein
MARYLAGTFRASMVSRAVALNKESVFVLAMVTSRAVMLGAGDARYR